MTEVLVVYGHKNDDDNEIAVRCVVMTSISRNFLKNRFMSLIIDDNSMRFNNTRNGIFFYFCCNFYKTTERSTQSQLLFMYF